MTDFLVDPRCERVVSNIEIVVHLETQPEAGGIAKEPGQPQSGVGRDRALAVNELVDPARGHPKPGAQPVLADAQGREKLFLFLEMVGSKLASAPLRISGIVLMP